MCELRSREDKGDGGNEGLHLAPDPEEVVAEIPPSHSPEPEKIQMRGLPVDPETLVPHLLAFSLHTFYHYFTGPSAIH